MLDQIAVLIPCYNEAPTIVQVINDFRNELPSADIYVYDNNSTDGTAELARNEGAIVRHEQQQGKGNVIRSMFRDIYADIYVMVDGDSTYPASKVHLIMEPVIAERADMVVGSRMESYTQDSFKLSHKFGNSMVKKMINFLFKADFQDILSGYRCFSRKFVKTVPLLSRGFEVETELTLQALDKRFRVEEVSIPYKERPVGSYSKINTYIDGLLIIKTALWLFKDYKPFRCFSFIAAICFILGLGFGAIPLYDYITTLHVTHPSTAVLSTGLILIAMISFVTGLILDTISRLHSEIYLLLSSDRENHPPHDPQ